MRRAPATARAPGAAEPRARRLRGRAELPRAPDAARGRRGALRRRATPRPSPTAAAAAGRLVAALRGSGARPAGAGRRWSDNTGPAGRRGQPGPGARRAAAGPRRPCSRRPRLSAGATYGVSCDRGPGRRRSADAKPKPVWYYAPRVRRLLRGRSVRPGAAHLSRPPTLDAPVDRRGRGSGPRHRRGRDHPRLCRRLRLRPEPLDVANLARSTRPCSFTDLDGRLAQRRSGAGPTSTSPAPAGGAGARPARRFRARRDSIARPSSTWRC